MAQSGRPHDVGFGMKVLLAVRSADVRFWGAGGDRKTFARIELFRF
jgi:hypothetical protein